ncbi:MAG: hypothetical protein ACHQ53_01100 [Polyangiales bacterium]
MRVWVIAGAVLALGGGWLVYRVATLEDRVTALNKRLGPEMAASSHEAGPKPATNHEQRILALEADVRALREELDALDAPPAGLKASAPGALNDKGAEQQILSVVERKANRIRDRQLEFHRSRWLEWREGALDGFSQQFGLSPWQTEQLHQLLSDEVDKMVEILRQPDALENPEQGVAAWVAALEQTDNAAHRLLDPAQNAAWDQARMVERKVLWPWLPNH